MSFALDLNEDIIEMPSMLNARSHAIDPHSVDFGCKHRHEPVPPEPNYLMADPNAVLVGRILNVPQRKRVSDLKHRAGRMMTGEVLKLRTGLRFVTARA